MPSPRFEPAIAAIEKPQNYALYGTATGIGWVDVLVSKPPEAFTASRVTYLEFRTL
jgi:hypothetical protein